MYTKNVNGRFQLFILHSTISVCFLITFNFTRAQNFIFTFNFLIIRAILAATKTNTLHIQSKTLTVVTRTRGLLATTGCKF